MLDLKESHHSHLHHMLFSDLTKIFLFRSILSFAQSMIFIFIPIFLFQLGYSMVYILAYALTIYVSVLLVDPIAVLLINRIGFRYSLLLSVPFEFLNFFLILRASSPIIVFAAAFCQGIHLSIFLTTLNSEIAVNGHNEKRGSEIGMMNMLMTLASTFSPIIGGAILQYRGYFSLLITALIIATIATIPLLSSQNIKLANYSFSYKDYFSLAKKYDARTKIFFLSEGVDIILLLYIWPIGLYLLLNENTLSLGSLLTAASFVSVALLWFFRRRLDTKPKKKYLDMSAKFVGIEYIFKFLSLSFGFVVYLAELISKVNRKVFQMSYKAIYFSNMNKQEYIDYILFCDLFGRLGRILCACTLMVIFVLFGTGLTVLFSTLFLGVIATYGLHFLDET